MAATNSDTRNRDLNFVDLAQFKGEIKPCPYCKPADRLTGRTCNWCLANGYIAMCKNCDGTGLETASAVWDGGKSRHSSTCNHCGGRGMYPARESEFIAAGGVVDEALDNSVISVGGAQPPTRPTNAGQAATRLK